MDVKGFISSFIRVPSFMFRDLGSSGSEVTASLSRASGNWSSRMCVGSPPACQHATCN